MSDGADSAKFLASFPAIQSAIKIYGDKQGMRLQLDVPESEMGEAVKVLLWREKVLTITIEPEKRDQGEDSGGTKRRQIHI